MMIWDKDIEVIETTANKLCDNGVFWTSYIKVDFLNHLDKEMNKAFPFSFDQYHRGESDTFNDKRIILLIETFCKYYDVPIGPVTKINPSITRWVELLNKVHGRTEDSKRFYEPITNDYEQIDIGNCKCVDRSVECKKHKLYHQCTRENCECCSEDCT